MTRIEKLKQDTKMIKAMRENLGLDETDTSKDSEIAKYDDVTIARNYLSWKASNEILDLTLD